MVIIFCSSLSIYFWEKVKDKGSTQTNIVMTSFQEQIINDLNKKKLDPAKNTLTKILSILNYGGVEVYNTKNKTQFVILGNELKDKNYKKVNYTFPPKSPSDWEFVFLKRNGRDLKTGLLSFNVLLLLAFICIIHLGFIIWKNIFIPFNEKIDNELKSVKKVEESTRNAKIVSEYSQKVIILINKDLQILNVQSQFSNQIFDTNLKDKNILESFFKKFNLLDKQLTKIESSFYLLFGDDTIQFSAVSSHLPKQATINFGQTFKSFNFFYIPLLDNDHKVEKVIISLVENTETKVLRKLVTSMKLQAKVLEDLYLNKDDQLLFKCLLKTKSLAITQIKSICSRLNNDFDPSFKEMFFYELSKATPKLPFFKAYVSDTKAKLEKKLEESNELDINFPSNADYFLIKDLVTIKYLIFLDHLAPISKIIKSYYFFNKEESKELKDLESQLWDLIEENMNTILDVYKNIFNYLPGYNKKEKIELKSLTKITKVVPNFEEAIKTIKLKSILLSTLFESANSENQAIFFRNLSERLNLITSRINFDEYMLKNGLLESFNMVTRKIHDIRKGHL